MQNSLVKLLSPLEFLFLILGVTLPLATIDEFWFFSSEFSIVSLAVVLLKNNEYVLGSIIVIFGIIIPSMKIFQRYKKVNFLKKWPLHKFSMLDIFLLSFLIFGGKLSYFYEVNLKLGFYFLLSSIFLSYLSLFITRQAKFE